MWEGAPAGIFWTGRRSLEMCALPARPRTGIMASDEARAIILSAYLSATFVSSSRNALKDLSSFMNFINHCLLTVRFQPVHMKPFIRKSYHLRVRELGDGHDILRIVRRKPTDLANVQEDLPLKPCMPGQVGRLPSGLPNVGFHIGHYRRVTLTFGCTVRHPVMTDEEFLLYCEVHSNTPGPSSIAITSPDC